jgi:hypothetical protein
MAEAERLETRYHELRRTPRSGDRVESLVPHCGRYARGTVHYVDDLQILIKWDDGRSASLRRGDGDEFRIVEPA